MTQGKILKRVVSGAQDDRRKSPQPSFGKRANVLRQAQGIIFFNFSSIIFLLTSSLFLI